MVGLRRSKCCGQGRKPQQLSEAKEYLLRLVEKSQQLKELFAAVSCKTAAIKCATEYLLRSHPKTAAINGFFFLNLFPIYCCVYTKTVANDKQQIRFFPLVYYRHYWGWCFEHYDLNLDYAIGSSFIIVM